MEHPSPRQLFLEERMTEARLSEVRGGSAAVFSAASPERDTPNEDGAALFELDDACVLAVADGVGGHAGGARAARTAVEALAESLDRYPQVTLRAAVLDGFERGHERVLALGIGAATTLVVAEVQNDKARTYHTGDSGACVVGGLGKRKLQTVFHSPTGYAVESGLMEEHEALRHEERHLVSNLIGAEQMSVEIGSPVALAARDTLVLGSDGLFDNLSIDEIAETVRKGPLERAARALADCVGRRMREPTEEDPGKPDDLTFILFRRRR